jgi:CPA2 family monovalent cation:H+ antiporter-2
MHLAPLIQDLAVILAVAGLTTLLFQKIRQPVVLGYLVAGIIVGPHTPPFQFVKDIHGVQIWAELGVVFLMFTLGLEFSFRKLARVGGSASITALTEVVVMMTVGYVVSRALGWSKTDGLFMGAILSISSTTIIIKALDELKLKSRRFAELIFGALIVEDLLAILLLVGLTTVSTQHSISGLVLLSAAAKLILVVAAWIIAGYFLLPRFMAYVGRVGNNELVTVVALGLCLGLVVIATKFEYSAALGAFIMGSILAETSLLHRIEARMAPLRDFFGAVFFVSIGMMIDPNVLWEHKEVVVLFSIITIVGKILSTSLGTLASGQTLKNSVQVGFGLAQIGEFSFIIAGLGATLEVTSDFIYPITVAVSLVTTFTTPYLIQVSGKAATKIENVLPARLQDVLTRYALWSETRRTGHQSQREFYLQLLRWVINGLVVSVVFVVTSEIALPHLSDYYDFASEVVLKAGVWLGALLLSAPFVWAMLTAFPRRGLHHHEMTRWFFRVVAVLWVGGLSTEFFPARYVMLGITVVLVSLFGIFYRRLERSYAWFERRFLSTFDTEGGNGEGRSSSEELRRLAPWDAHLVKLVVHPNAKIAVKRIDEAKLRTRCGVNIVVIHRGEKTIVSPLPSEMILPGDELLVLGTDEQIEKFRDEVEPPQEMLDKVRTASDYEMRHLRLTKHSPFTTHTIRQSGIREDYGAIVVGLERKHERSINPDSDLELESGDILWVVGEKKHLDRLAAARVPDPGS